MVLVAPAMSDQSVPPLVLSCHLTVGVGFPDAAAVNDADVPAATVVSDGFVVTDGATSTVSAAEVDVAVP